MKLSVLLIAGACSLGQPMSRSEWELTPQLASGLELVYSGTCVEESMTANVQFQRQYTLETLVFVVDAQARKCEVAIMTALGERRPRLEPGAKETILASVRLEMAQVGAQGRLADHEGMVPLLALVGPPTYETGCFVEAPAARVTRSSLWEVNEGTRPPHTWQVGGVEAVSGVTCVKLVGQQQSRDWDRPRADQTAWRRRDLVWFSPQQGVVQKVQRVIERRDPARRDPTQRITVEYELKSRIRYPGRLYDDRKQEILKARKFQEDAAPLLKQPVQYRAQLEALIKKVSFHVENQAPTPYRKAVFHLAGRLESAKNGTGQTTSEEAIEENPRPVAAVDIGQRIPDFVVNELGAKQGVRMSRLLGRPVLVFFYNPVTQIGSEVLQFTKGLAQRHGDKIGLMAMAVTTNPAQAKQQHAEMQLPFAILDGQAMRLTFGATDTPRLVLLDADGVVRVAYTGWSSQVAREIQNELAGWLKK